MVVVIHYGTNKDPDVYFGIDEKAESRILRDLKTSWFIERSSVEEWPKQNDPRYAVHHWNAKKKKGV